MDFKYDIQLLIEHCVVDQEVLRDRIQQCARGEKLFVEGDESMMKVRFFTSQPWAILQLCDAMGSVYDIVIIDRERVRRGLQG